jgi:hypothetical protein
VADSKDAVNISVYKLQTVTFKYELKFSKNKGKAMAFRGRDPMGSKILINNDILEEINTFIYLSCSFSYHN